MLKNDKQFRHLSSSVAPQIVARLGELYVTPVTLHGLALQKLKRNIYSWSRHNSDAPHLAIHRAFCFVSLRVFSRTTASSNSQGLRGVYFCTVTDGEALKAIGPHCAVTSWNKPRVTTDRVTLRLYRPEFSRESYQWRLMGPSCGRPWAMIII